MLKLKTTVAAVAATTLLAGAANAASLVIDDFDQTVAAGVSVSGMMEVASNSDMYTSPSMIDFIRTLNVSTTEALGDNIFIGSDKLTVNSGATGDVIGSVRWELADTSGGLDLTGSKAFQANVENGSVSSNTDQVNATLTLVSGIGTMSEMTFTYDFIIDQGDMMIDVELSNFVGQVDLTDIDAIVFGYTSDAEGVDFTLTDALVTTAVPVPGALILMGSAVAGFAARRRKAS